MAPRSRCSSRAPSASRRRFSDIVQHCHTRVVHPGPLQKGEAWEVLTISPSEPERTHRAQRRSGGSCSFPHKVPPAASFPALCSCLSSSQAGGWGELQVAFHPRGRCQILSLSGATLNLAPSLGVMAGLNFPSESLIFLPWLGFCSVPGRDTEA